MYAALGVPWCPPELREPPFNGEPPRLVDLADIRGDLHCHTTWSDGRASVEEMGRAAIERGYEYLAICDHTPAVGAVQGLTPDDVRRQAEEIAAANEKLAPFRVLRGIECDILPDGRLDLPDDVLAELDWVQASVHGGQRMPRPEMTKRVEEALRNPSSAASATRPGGSSPAGPENAVDLDRVYELALEHGVAVEVNGLARRLDLRGEHVRDAIAAGVRSSARPTRTPRLANMELAVRTARRGGATAADVLNTRPLDKLLGTLGRLAARGDRLDAGDLAPDDERLDRVRALEGEDRLHVGEVARDVVLEQDAVAAEDVARVGDDRRALAALLSFASDAMPSVSRPSWASPLARQQSSCIVVTSASMRESLSWTSWKPAIGLPNCSRSSA